MNSNREKLDATPGRHQRLVRLLRLGMRTNETQVWTCCTLVALQTLPLMVAGVPWFWCALAALVWPTFCFVGNCVLPIEDGGEETSTAEGMCEVCCGRGFHTIPHRDGSYQIDCSFCRGTGFSLPNAQAVASRPETDQEP